MGAHTVFAHSSRKTRSSGNFPTKPLKLRPITTSRKATEHLFCGLLESCSRDSTLRRISKKPRNTENFNYSTSAATAAV